MAQLRLNLESLSPLLMYGADQDEAELRGTSFRGILRYWFRAVLATKYPDPKKLFEKESEILGSTGQGSKLSLRLQPSRGMQAEEDQWVMPERTSKGYRPRFYAYPAETQFRLILSSHPLEASGILDANSDLLKALFLMLYIGGLGRRARRGSGNLRVIEAHGYENPELPLAITTINRTELRDYLQLITKHISGQAVSTRPDFATFAPNSAVILLSQETHSSYEDAFKELWAVSGPYHHEGGIFGDISSRETKRRASSIHMRVHLTGAGYVAQQSIFYAGAGKWESMKDYIQVAQTNGFERIFGDAGAWK